MHDDHDPPPPPPHHHFHQQRMKTTATSPTISWNPQLHLTPTLRERGSGFAGLQAGGDVDPELQDCSHYIRSFLPRPSFPGTRRCLVFGQPSHTSQRYWEKWMIWRQSNDLADNYAPTPREFGSFLRDVRDQHEYSSETMWAIASAINARLDYRYHTAPMKNEFVNTLLKNWTKKDANKKAKYFSAVDDCLQQKGMVIAAFLGDPRLSALSSAVNQDTVIASNITCRINLEGALNPELISAGDQYFYIVGENIVRWEDTAHFFSCGCHFILFDSASLYYNLFGLFLFCSCFCPLFDTDSLAAEQFHSNRCNCRPWSGTLSGPAHPSPLGRRLLIPPCRLPPTPAYFL